MKIFLSFLSFIVFFSRFSCPAQTPFRVSQGVEIQNLDPSEAEDFLTMRLVMNLQWGLIRLNKDLKPVPAFEIAKTPEGKKRRSLIIAAQKILLTDEVVIFPLFHYVQYLLIRDRWLGLDLTPMGILYFQRAHLQSSL